MKEHTPLAVIKKPSAENRIDAKELADYVLKVQRDVILNLSPELNKEGISFPQFFLLMYLTSEESVTMGDVAKKMGHSTAAATGVIDRLEKKGMVERSHSQEDRRKVMIRITPKGTEFVAEKRKEISKKLQEMLTDVTEVGKPV